MTTLEKQVVLSLALGRVAKSAGISMSAGRKFLRELAMLPAEEGDALIAEARTALLRELSAELRKRRTQR